ncbi:hypothetical protein ACFLR7_04250 [Acidobacteriota bacterium]
MIKYLIPYVQYKDIFDDFPYTLSEIGKILSGVHHGSVLESLCKINIALWKLPHDASLQIHLARTFFDEPDARRIIDFAKSTNRITFHRQQILYLIKLVITCEASSTNSSSSFDDQKLILGKVILSMNSHIETLVTDYFKLSDSEEIERLRQSLARKWYFTHSGISGNKIARTLILWEKIPRSKRGRHLLQETNINPKREFYRETGITILEFIGIALAFYAKYQHLDPKNAPVNDYFLHKSNYLKTTKLKKVKKTGALEQIILNRNTFQKDYDTIVNEVLGGEDIPELNYLPFEDKPFLELLEDQLITIDPIFLTKKVTEGIYWILLNRFKRLGEFNTGRGRELSKYYGLLIQEYVFQALRMLCDEVIELPLSQTKTADFIGISTVNTDKYLIVIDSKKISLSYKTLILSDRESTKQDLKKIFGEKKGFEQIYETIKRVRSNQLDGFTIDIDKIKGIVPLIITDQCIFEDPFNRLFYEKEFFEHHKNKLIYTPRPSILEPVFIGLDELEVMEAYCIENGALHFIQFLLQRNEILEKRFDHKKIQNLPRELVPLWNDLYMKGYMKHENKHLMGIFRQFHRKFSELFFNKIKKKSNS